MERILIACADVGSVKKGRFGWADNEGGAGTLPSELTAKVAAALVQGRSVALGFECPMFVPVQTEEVELGKQRTGEDGRPWSAGAGCAALVTGMVQAAWILRAIHDRCPSTRAYTNWEEFRRSAHGLLLWEAFVSGTSKGSGHVNDAKLAVEAFERRLPTPETDVDAINPMSLAGLALLWSGLLVSTDVLRQPCLVIKA